MKSFKSFFSESYEELEEQKMTFQDAEKLKSKHLAAMQHHKRSGNSKGYAAHLMVVDKFEDAYDRHGTGVIPVGRIMSASQKAFKDHPHSGMKESVDLDEKYKDPWTAPRKGSSAWHAAQQRKKAERDPEEVKRVNAIGNKNHMIGTAKITHNEEVDIDEAIEFRHDRYMRSHGKKASGGSGHWMFTHKNTGDVDYNNEKEVHMVDGKFADAKKSAQQWAKKHGHDTVYVMEEVDLGENTFKIKKLPGYRKTVTNEVGNSIHHFNDGSKVYAAQGQSSSGRTLQYHKIKKNGEREVHSQTSLTKSFKKEEVDLGENIAGRFKDASEWERSAKARGLVVKPATHPSGEMTKYQIAKDKQGNNRGHFDHGTKTGQLHEVSDKKLDAYRQKAFADQPSGDDGSDKYRKRKFGRDLAFAKQTGRAKVLATKEEFDLTESHFNVGDRVKCVRSGMLGTVVKSDKPEVGKYYTVKQDSGKLMKYASNELKAM